MTPDEHLRLLIGDLMVQLAIARAERDMQEQKTTQDSSSRGPGESVNS